MFSIAVLSMAGRGTALVALFRLRAYSRSPWRAHCGVKMELEILTYSVYAPILILISILPCTASRHGGLNRL